MNILCSLESDEIRKHYINAFVDTNSNYYRNKIERLTEFSDGRCYIGYLWDCLKKPKIISENEALQVLKNKSKIFVMWDIHSCERILIPNYWRYPKSSVLVVNLEEDGLKLELPEDIYLFDSSFTWSIVYTHEYNAAHDRYCLYQGSCKTGDGSVS